MRLVTDSVFWDEEQGKADYGELINDIKVPVAVIGGGITGALVSHALIQAGFETILIEKNTIASGSTAASTSFLQYETDLYLKELANLIGLQPAVDVYLQSLSAIGNIENIIEQCKIKCSFKKKQSVLFAHSKRLNAQLAEEFHLRKQFIPGLEFIEGKELKNKYKIASEAAILSPTAAAMDPVAFTRQLIQYNTKKGLKVFTNTNIQVIGNAGDKKLLITATNKRIVCQKLVFCTGYESFNFIKKHKAKLFSTWALATEKGFIEDEIFEGTLFWNTASPYLYFTATNEGRLMLGGGDTFFRPAMFTEALKTRKTKYISRKYSYYTGNEIVEPSYTWGGVFGSSPDSLPYIGRVDGEENFLAVIGLGGNGIVFSAIGMEMITAMLKGKKHPMENYFMPDRFS